MENYFGGQVHAHVSSKQAAEEDTSCATLKVQNVYFRQKHLKNGRANKLCSM